MTKANMYPLNDARAFSLTGPGFVETCANRLYNGSSTVKLTSPNVLPVPSEGQKACTSLIWKTAPQDWSDYRQLTLHVYPDCPGLQCLTLEIALCSGGQVSAFHQVQLTGGTWNPAVWDLSGVERSSVTQVVIRRRLTGRQQSMSNSAVFYLGGLTLDAAVPGENIAALPKELPWREIAESGLAYFRAHRCGGEVPGVHLPCHSDCFTVHPDGRRVFLSGGWHDLGDLSHSLENTALAARSLMALADAIPEEETALRDQLLDEARHGLEWMQFTRFRDGYRCVEARIPYWTDEVIGTADDVLCEAHNDPYANFCAAAVSAKASIAFKDEDAVFALYCLNCAKDDFRFAYEHMYLHEMIYGIRELKAELPLHAQALCAAAELYIASGEASYLDYAVRFADIVCACMDQATGSFCEDRQLLNPCDMAASVLAIRGLSLLTNIAAAHPQNDLWRTVLAACDDRLHRESAAPGIQAGMHDPQFFGALMTRACEASTAARALKDADLMAAARASIRWLLGDNPFKTSFMNGVCGGSLPLWDAFCARHTGGIRSGLHVLPDGRLDKTVDGDCCRSELTPLSCLLLTLSDCIR